VETQGEETGADRGDEITNGTRMMTRDLPGEPPDSFRRFPGECFPTHTDGGIELTPCPTFAFLFRVFRVFRGSQLKTTKDSKITKVKRRNEFPEIAQIFTH
jgi:hypothetical protein